jgi:hypothetical protein
MKSKQLANVLIKIIGLYVCLCAIPGLVTGILALCLWISGMPKLGEKTYYFSFAIGDTVEALVGIFLIVKSRTLAEYWFKDETE